MQTENKTNVTTFKKWIPAVILLAAVALFAAAFFLLKPAAKTGSKQITVDVIHADLSKATYHYGTDAEYLRQVLCEEAGLISGREEAYGLWITTVDGETADDSIQQWWGYEVNGEMAMYGVEQMPVNDGDVIVFTLNTGY